MNSTWQPIETAPKDGTGVLLGGWWDGDAWAATGRWRHDHYPDPAWVSDASTVYGPDDDKLDPQPDFWMPLNGLLESMPPGPGT